MQIRIPVARSTTSDAPEKPRVVPRSHRAMSTAGYQVMSSRLRRIMMSMSFGTSACSSP